MRIAGKLRGLLRRPVVHFLVLGAAMFGVREFAAVRVLATPASSPQIVISSARRSLIREQLRLEPGSPEITAGERSQIDRAIDEEILYREALAHRLDQDNALVRDRVVLDMRLVANDPNADEGELEREGLRLGLDRSDLVVRRHLAATMRMLTMAPARLEEPSDEQLQVLLERNAARFRTPSTVSIVHVFVSARRGATEAAAFARRLADEFHRDRARPEEALRRGDAFALGSELAGRSAADLDAVFGAGFASSVDALPEREWSDPIASSYGLHLVWVRSREPARLPLLASVRSRVVDLFRQQRAEERLAAWLSEQRSRYRIRIEEPAAAEAAILTASLPVKNLNLPRGAAEVGD